MRRGCESRNIVALVRNAIAAVGRPIEGLAAPSFKRQEAGLQAASALLGFDLLFIEDSELHAAQPFCITHSSIAERAVGYASIAEASALAAAGPRARLVLPRIRGLGVTCAVAERL